MSVLHKVEHLKYVGIDLTYQNDRHYHTCIYAYGFGALSKLQNLIALSQHFSPLCFSIHVSIIYSVCVILRDHKYFQEVND